MIFFPVLQEIKVTFILIFSIICCSPRGSGLLAQKTLRLSVLPVFAGRTNLKVLRIGYPPTFGRHMSTCISCGRAPTCPILPCYLGIHSNGDAPPIGLQKRAIQFSNSTGNYGMPVGKTGVFFLESSIGSRAKALPTEGSLRRGAATVFEVGEVVKLSLQGLLGSSKSTRRWGRLMWLS